MKKIIISLLFLMGMSAVAQHHLSADQAMTRVGLSHATLSGKHRAPASKSSLYYVFNLEEGGFIVASADDRARAVLGRTDSGEWNPDQMPPAMRGWLESMEEALAKLAASSESVVPSLSASSRRKAAATRVEPLLGDILWGQGEPYFNECPAIGSTHSATGCAATAMAQIMRYHKYPERGKGSCSYVSETIKFDINEDFNSTVYDWGHMKPSYPISADGQTRYYTEEEATAVARLMYHIGAASEMDYNTGASGTTEGPMLTAMIDNFSYDKSLQIFYRENYTSQEWYELIQSEIDAKRPILMNGYSISGGHAFVIDGYDTTMGSGYFHFNWGWNGMSNGYYSVDIADPGQQGTGGSLGGYSYNQNIFCNIRPNANGVASPNLCVSAALRYEYGQLHYQWLNRGCGAFTGQVGYVIEDGGKQTFHSYKSYSAIGFRAGSGSIHQAITAPTKAGLRYYLAQSVGGVITPLRPLIGATEVLVSVPDGAGFTLVPETSGLADLETVSLAVDGKAYAGTTINFTLSLRNNGEQEYNGALYLCMTETDGVNLGYEDHATDNPLGVYIRPGETVNVSFPYYGTPATGTYILQVLYNPRNGSGLQHIAGQTLTFNVVPYGSKEENEDLPVLRVLSQSISATTLKQGDPLTLTTTVNNTGGADAITVGGIIYQKVGYNWNQVAILGQTSKSFEKGENTLTFAGALALSPGDYRIVPGSYTAGLWSKFIGAENSEFTIESEQGPAPEPTGELRATSLTLTNGTAYAGQPISFSYTLDNGTAETFSDFVMLNIDYLNAQGEVVKSDDTPFDQNMMDLEAGKSASSSIIIENGLPEGRYRARLYYYDWDNGNTYFPGVSLDFVVEKAIDLRPAELTLSSQSLSVEKVAKGGELSFTFNATNAGGQGKIRVGLVAQKHVSGKNYNTIGQIFVTERSFESGANEVTLTETIDLEPGMYRFFPARDDNGWWEAYNYNYLYLEVTEATEPAASGDVNNDGAVNVGDLTALVSFILGTQSSDYVREAADLNNDGTVNVTDYTLLVNRILNTGN